MTGEEREKELRLGERRQTVACPGPGSVTGGEICTVFIRDRYDRGVPRLPSLPLPSPADGPVSRCCEWQRCIFSSVGSTRGGDREGRREGGGSQDVWI